MDWCQTIQIYMFGTRLLENTQAETIIAAIDDVINQLQVNSSWRTYFPSKLKCFFNRAWYIQRTSYCGKRSTTLYVIRFLSRKIKNAIMAITMATITWLAVEISAKWKIIETIFLLAVWMQFYLLQQERYLTTTEWLTWSFLPFYLWAPLIQLRLCAICHIFFPPLS